jgi:hypothetical protein
VILGRNYRFTVNNSTAVNVGVVIQARRFKFDSSGVISWDTETEVYNEATITPGATSWTADTAIDNSTDKWVGADLEIVITPASAATGPVSVQIEHSTDGGTTWPSGGQGAQLGGVYFSASSAAVTKSVRIE